MKLARPTFDEFIQQIKPKILGVIAKRLYWLHEQDDAYQEILLAIWKAWPKFDWNKAPVGLAMTIAMRTAADHARHVRCKQRGKIMKDEIAFGIDEQEWSAREATSLARARLAEPPQLRPWVEALYEEDRALVDLATALARSGRLLGNVPGYIFHMEQWFPKTWPIAEIKTTISHWQHRLDNFRVAWDKGNCIGDGREPRCTRSAERKRLLDWTRHQAFQKVLKKVMSFQDTMTGTHPHLRREHAKGELAEWFNRCWDISGKGICLAGYRKRTTEGTQVEHTVPTWIFSGEDDWRACQWFRRNWSDYARNINEFGLLPWEKLRLARDAAQKRGWNAKNAGKITSYLSRPEVKKRRRFHSREWYRAHREICRLSNKRWIERRRSDGNPVV